MKIRKYEKCHDFRIFYIAFVIFFSSEGHFLPAMGLSIVEFGLCVAEMQIPKIALYRNIEKS
jgi:hypothetical protein